MGIMANPFYLDMGYTKSEIVSVAKVFGFFMSIAGSALCGVLVVKWGVMKPLLLGAVLVILAGFWVGRWISKAILNVLERRNVDVTLRQFIASTIRALVLVLFGIVALSQLGISITPPIA